MANAKQCDICGEFYAAVKVDRKLRPCYGGETDAVILIHATPNSDTPDDMPGHNEEMESCPKCMKKIEAFIDGLKEKKDV